MIDKEIKINNEKLNIFTEGLTAYLSKEIIISKGIHSDDDYTQVIKYLIDYIITNNVIIQDGQTIAYHSWLLKFSSDNHHFLTLYEIDKVGENFISGVDIAISITKMQSEICFENNVIPVFPTFGQNIVISKGVYEGKDVEGIRYDSPEHMTGWWLVTDDYDDNIDSLMNVHFYHLAFARQDIIGYLALPSNYRFLQEKEKFEILIDSQ